MYASFRQAVAEARRHGDLYFAGLLSEDRILEAFGSARWFWQGWVYTPAVTVWVFLSQCLSPDHSCREAVARLIGWRLVQGVGPCSADTGAYCTVSIGRLKPAILRKERFDVSVFQAAVARKETANVESAQDGESSIDPPVTCARILRVLPVSVRE